MKSLCGRDFERVLMVKRDEALVGKEMRIVRIYVWKVMYRRRKVIQVMEKL